MPERCDICGIAALESEHFAAESLPFVRTKRYCPACRQRLYRRVFGALGVILILVCCISMFDAWRRHINLLESDGVKWGLLIIFQWLMILPHELGHAAAGRAVGFTQIRILVGSSKPLFSFRLFGIPTLIDLIPFGGITVFKAVNPVARWRYLVFVGAGLLVNLAAATIAWGFFARGQLFNFQSEGVGRLFFWANVIVLMENLLPYRVDTPFGPLANDGLLLWNTLFRWKKPIKREPARLTFWKSSLQNMLKLTIFIVMIAGVVICVGIAALAFGDPHGGWQLKILLPVIMFALALLSGWAAMRIAKDPIGTGRTPVPGTGVRQLLLSLTPGQRQLLRQATERATRHDFAAAEALLDQALDGMPNSKAIECWPIVLMKLAYIISQKDIDRAEKLCLDCVERTTTTEGKVTILDGFVCHLLYTSASPFLGTAERLARQALELAPGSLTLQGSLGGILVEQGRFAEAEPLLRECLDRSPALHDQGISAFYLGVVRLDTGDRNKARQLIKRSMVLHPEPWLLAKAELKLRELDHTI